MSARPTEQAPVPRSLLRTAVWSAAGAVVVCVTLGVIAVAICWLPVSGQSGRTHSAIAAGLLTYLAGLGGGITVAGMSATWVPFGMTLIVAFVAWRVGAHLAEAADAAEIVDTRTLVRAGVAQAATFSALSVLAVHFATLGTSHGSYVASGAAAFVLFLASGGVSFLRATPLREIVASRLPMQTNVVVRAAVAALLLYVAAGAFLVAASLVWHHGRVTDISRAVGGGWASVPILVLSLLAVPNALVAGAGYLAGPGVAIGPAHASAFGSAHGVLPSFPLLGALPDGHGANTPTLVLIALTPLAAGVVVARLIRRSCATVGMQCVLALAAATCAGLLAALAAFLTGGGIGSRNLASIGVPAGWFALLVTGALATASAAALGLAALWSQVRHSVGADEHSTTAYEHDVDEPVDGPAVDAEEAPLVQVVSPDAVPSVEAQGEPQDGQRAG
jgi:hypothetical protein